MRVRDQAVSKRRPGRRRISRSASSIGVRKRTASALRWVLRAVPRLVYLSLLILAAWLLYYSLVSQYFTVREIAVSGNRLLSAAQARDAAALLGRNLLLLRIDDIEQSIRGLSVVKEARAFLTMPDRVEIDITERTPLVQWQTREGSFLVDEEGIAFSREAPPASLIVVRELDGSTVELGGRVDPDVIAGVEVLAAALPQRAGIQPQWFDYSRSAGIAVPVPGGPRILFGDANDLDSKLAALAAIRQHLEATKARAQLIDLRFKGRPTYVLAAPAATKPGQAR